MVCSSIKLKNYSVFDNAKAEHHMEHVYAHMARSGVEEHTVGARAGWAEIRGLSWEKFNRPTTKRTCASGRQSYVTYETISKRGPNCLIEKLRVTGADEKSQKIRNLLRTSYVHTPPPQTGNSRHANAAYNFHSL